MRILFTVALIPAVLVVAVSRLEAAALSVNVMRAGVVEPSGGQGVIRLPSMISVQPERLLDTRVGLGAPATRVPATGVLKLAIAGKGTARVPMAAAAVSLNVTAVDAGEAGFVTTYPCDKPIPTTSTLNIGAHGTVANAVITAMAADGSVCFYSQTTVHLLVDVEGWAPPTSPLHAFTPERFLDTRNGKGRVPAGQTVVVPVAGRQPVGVNASAVAINVAAVDADADGFLTVYPCDSPRPVASNLNYGARGTRANLVMSGVSAAGTVCIFSYASTHLIADVSAEVVGAGYVPLTPTRLIDTRSSVSGYGRLAAGIPIDVPIAAPGASVGAALNITAVAAAEAGFITVWPCDEERPEASNLNFEAGGAFANLAAVKLAANGHVCVYSSAATDFLVDLNGTFDSWDSDVSLGRANISVLAGTATGTSIPMPRGHSFVSAPTASNAAMDVNISGAQHDATDFFDVQVNAKTAVAANSTTAAVLASCVTPLIDGFCPPGASATLRLQLSVAVVASGLESGILVGATPGRWIVEADGVPRLADQVLAVLSQNADVTTVRSAIQGLGGVIVASESGALQVRFGGLSAEETEAKAIALRGVVGVVSASRQSATTQTTQVPSDWSDDGVAGWWEMSKIKAPRAWDRTTGSTATEILVADSSTYRYHEDLPSPLSYRVSDDWTIADLIGRDHDHGTHVSGLVCGQSNGIGLVGVMWKCGLHLVNWHGDDALVVSSMRAALASSPKIRAVNMSFGNGATNPDPKTGVCPPLPGQALVDLFRKMFGDYPNVLFVVAAGNCGTKGKTVADVTPANLGSMSNVLVVGSIDSNGAKSNFSNTGFDVAAPGGVFENASFVWSSTHACDDPVQVLAYGRCRSTYGQMAGTSMAAPLVTGAAGLMFDWRPALTASQAKTCIVQTATSQAGGPPSLQVPEALDCAERAVTVAPPATGSLSVAFSENPYRCDGAERPFGTISGAAPGEVIGLSSPSAGVVPLASRTADGSGRATIYWRCNPNEAPGSWIVNAVGNASGRRVSYTVSGVGPPPPTATPLTVSFSQNPFRCDGSSHGLGTLGNAAAGERITFTSPTVSGLLPGTANGSGQLGLIWQCNPNEAGQSWTVTAVGQSSGRNITFTVVGEAPPQTTVYNEVAWGRPGSTVPLFSGGPGANSNGAAGPAASIVVGSVIQTNCRSYNLAVAPSNGGGWWYHLAAGTYNGYWTPASVYENGSGAWPATGAVWDPAVPVC
jgi:hypothetical protein